MTETFKDFYLSTIKLHIIIAIIIAGGAFFLGYKDFSLGIIFGSVLAALIFRYFYTQIKRIEQIETVQTNKIFASFFIKYVLTYIIIAIFMFVAIKKSLAVFVGLSVALLLIKIQLFLRKSSL